MSKFREFINRKLSTSAVLVLSFLAVILVGTLLLSLPVSHASGAEVSVMDALFTATSATCVTGLLTITCGNDLSLFGQIVVLIMIQIGGLGLMTFVALIMLSMKQKLAVSEIKVLKDGLNKADFENVSDYIRKIVRFTFYVEMAGFILLLPAVYDGSIYSVFSTFFLSISAFCNAGIETLGNSSLAAYDTNVLVNVVVCVLITMGGLGFAVWFDLSENLSNLKQTNYDFRYYWSQLSVHTRIVLLMSLILTGSAAVMIFGFEYGNALAPYGLFDKIQTSIFSSVTLRTAGFYTIDFSILKAQTKIIMILYMIIGASPGGTGGGIKTTTIFLLIYSVYCQFRGDTEMVLFKRHIPKSNIIRAMTLMIMCVSLLFISMLVLTLDKFESLDLLYEAASAMGTVGISTGITGDLSLLSEWVIIALMFLGRLGPITVAMALRKRESARVSGVRYPEREIIVG